MLDGDLEDGVLPVGALHGTETWKPLCRCLGSVRPRAWSLQNPAGVTQTRRRHEAARAFRGPEVPASPMICGKEPLSKSSSTVPVCKQVRSSNRLCSDSVDTWGLLQRSPPSSTFSSNFIHLEGVRMGLSVATALRSSPHRRVSSGQGVLASKSCACAACQDVSQAEDLGNPFTLPPTSDAVVLRVK